MSALAAALDYAARGWAVFPCEPRGKAPITTRGKDDATADPEAIARMFRLDSNIGVAVGPSGIVVVDVDDDHRGGGETFAALVAILGELPPTITADTGGGGAHYLFRAPSVDIVAKLGKGVDLISRGYIVAAPSIHPSGRAYRWRAGLGPSEIALAELPIAWIERARRAAPPVAIERARRPTDDADQTFRRASAYLARMPEAIQGQDGSGALFVAALAMSVGFELSTGDTFAILATEYNPRCVPPWSERELRHKIDDASKSTTVPRGYLRDQDSPSCSRGAPRLHVVPYADAPHPADRSDAAHDEAIFAARDHEEPMAVQNEPARRWGRLISTLADDVIRLREQPLWSWGWPLLDREAAVPIGSLVYVMGATGRGKTSLLLVVAAIHGHHRGPVLFLSAELSAAILGARLVSQSVDGSTWAGVVKGDVSPEEIRAALEIPRMRVVDRLTSAWPALLAAELAAMRAECVPGEAPLVILDYLQIAKLTGGRDVREEVSGASARLRELAAEHSAVIVAISRMNRGGAKAARNSEIVGVDGTEAGAESGAIEHDAVVQLMLGAMAPESIKDPDGPQIVQVSICKTRFGASDKVIPYRYDGARGTFEEIGPVRRAAELRDEATQRRKQAKASGKTTAADKLADRRIGALEMAHKEGSISITRYMGKAGLGKTAAGDELVLLGEAGLLASAAPGAPRRLTAAGAALLGGGPESRRVALARALGGEP